MEPLCVCVCVVLVPQDQTPPRCVPWTRRNLMHGMHGCGPHRAAAYLGMRACVLLAVRAFQPVLSHPFAAVQPALHRRLGVVWGVPPCDGRVLAMGELGAGGLGKWKWATASGRESPGLPSKGASHTADSPCLTITCASSSGCTLCGTMGGFLAADGIGEHLATVPVAAGAGARKR